MVHRPHNRGSIMGTPSDLLVVYQDPRGDLNFRHCHVDEGSDPSMRSKLFFLVLLISLNVPLVYSAPDEGYGEANENLGQFTDTFENEDYVTVLEDVIINTTFECVELNYTDLIILTNDTFQLREHDRYVVQTPAITFSIFGDDELRYDSTMGGAGIAKGFFYGDTDYLNDKYVRVRWLWTGTVSNSYPLFFEVWDDIYNRGDDTDFPEGAEMPAKGAGNLYLYREGIGRNIWVTRDFLLDLDGWGSTQDEVTIFLMLYDAWIGADVGGQIDWIELNTGAGGTGNIWTLDFTGTQDVVMEVLGTDGDYGYIDDSGLPLFTGGFEDDGYFLTEDYLNETQGNSLTLLTNASLPPSTGITVQFSSDNETWVDNHGNAGSSTVRANFSALDLRDLNYSDCFMRYNLSGPGAVTPRLYQSRIVTTNGTAGGAPGPGVTVIESDAPWIALAIILSIIAFLLAMRIKR